MMRLDWVPLPAPGGPSSTTGPTLREVSCAIGLAKASRPQTPRRPSTTAEVQQPPYNKIRLLPRTAAADAAAAWREAIVMAHDQLRLDLRDRIHGHTDDNQQRRSAEVKVHAQAIRHPGRQRLKKPAEGPGKVVEVNAGNQPFRDERNNDQVQRTHQRDSRQHFIDEIC